MHPPADTGDYPHLTAEPTELAEKMELAFLSVLGGLWSENSISRKGAKTQGFKLGDFAALREVFMLSGARRACPRR